MKPNRLFFLILGLGLGLRLYEIGTPLADWHSFRQADTASVAREYVKHGIDLLHPRYHDMSNIQSGHDNPEGYRMVEFPLINGLVAASSPFIPLPLHVWYRLVDVCFSLGSLVLLYLITRSLFNSSTALIAALIFAILPYNVYYSRAIFPEIPMVFFSLLATYLFFMYVDVAKYRGTWLFGSTIAAAIALLIKPVAVFFFPPLVVYLVAKRGWRALLDWKLVLALSLSLAPLLFWRQWITRFPDGIPASTWLLNGNGIRLRPAWFRWLFYERLTKLVLGYAGMLPFIVGLWTLFKKPVNAFMIGSGLSFLLYLAIFATGNVQHDYYQVPLIPLVSIIIALGIYTLLRSRSFWLKSLAPLSILLMLWFSWSRVSGYYHVNHWEIVAAGQAVDRLTSPDALVIAPYMGDTAFLYQTNRRGWPLGYDIDKKIKQGAQYYVSVNYDDEARELEQKYRTVEKTDRYLIVQLTTPEIP